MRLAVALGSNLGDRAAHLRRAARALREELHQAGGVFLASGIYATTPVDCPPGAPEFYNAVVELECHLPAREVLRWTRSWEEGQGRPASHGWHEPRTMDLDLLYYGSLVLAEEDLVLPHPRATERLFVLVPLAEIAPARRPPGWAQTVGETLAALRQSGGTCEESMPRRQQEELLKAP